MKARTALTVAEGVTGALLAHLAIAVVLGASDVLAGRWVFYTPGLLGSMLFDGAVAGCRLTAGATAVIAYSGVHLIVMMLFGVLATSLLQASERHPALWFGALLTFVVVAWHLVGVVLGIVARAQDCISLWVVMAAGLAGALAMAAYLGRAHPRMRRLLHGDRYA